MSEHEHGKHHHREEHEGQAVDPVCGMQVAEDSPLRISHEGQTYRFCSEHCLGSFRANPEQYLKGEGGPA